MRQRFLFGIDEKKQIKFAAPLPHKATISFFLLYSLGATAYRYALLIFIIPDSIRIVKQQCVFQRKRSFLSFSKIYCFCINLLTLPEKSDTITNKSIPESGRRSIHAPRNGGDIMNYVTWSDLIQYSILLVAVASLLYDIFHNKRK